MKKGSSRQKIPPQIYCSCRLSSSTSEAPAGSPQGPFKDWYLSALKHKNQKKGHIRIWPICNRNFWKL